MNHKILKLNKSEFMSELSQRKLRIDEIENQMVKCCYCNQDVQFNVLAYHQYFCQKAQSRERTQNVGPSSMGKIYPARKLYNP